MRRPAKRTFSPDSEEYRLLIEIFGHERTAMVPEPLQLGRAIGLVVEVKHVELAQHCAERSKYHSERADAKEAELPKLKAALEAIKGQPQLAQSVSHMNKGGYNLDTEDPIERLERDITTHRNKSLTFKYLGEHLLDVPYILDKSDLQNLEILK